MIKKKRKLNKLTEEQFVILQRRQFIKGMFMTAGGIGLRSFLLGLPPAFIARQAVAATNPTALILTSRRSADPINANAPGTYINGIDHSGGFSNPQTLTLGDVTSTAAAPWANLPADFRQNLQIIHHTTSTTSHNETPSVMRLNGAVQGIGGTGQEMLISAIAQHTAAGLGTVDSKPVDLGGTGFDLTVTGTNQGVQNPRNLKDSLGGGVSPQEQQLAEFAVQAQNKLYASLRTPAQKDFFERNVNSIAEAKVIASQLPALLEDINGNGLNDRVIAAVAVVASRTAPAALFGIDFGGDNHGDTNLSREIDRTTSGLAAIANMWDRLKAVDMADKTTYCQYNVFGRTLDNKNNGGRDHGRHSIMMMQGPKVVGGVSGAPDPNSGRGNVRGINSSTGTTDSPDITREQTLASAGKTLMKACGLDDGEIETRISGGKIIESAVNRF